jgi:hypothetical protein
MIQLKYIDKKIPKEKYEYTSAIRARERIWMDERLQSFARGTISHSAHTHVH